MRCSQRTQMVWGRRSYAMSLLAIDLATPGRGAVFATSWPRLLDHATDEINEIMNRSGVTVAFITDAIGPTQCHHRSLTPATGQALYLSWFRLYLLGDTWLGNTGECKSPFDLLSASVFRPFEHTIFVSLDLSPADLVIMEATTLRARRILSLLELDVTTSCGPPSQLGNSRTFAHRPWIRQPAQRCSPSRGALPTAVDLSSQAKPSSSILVSARQATTLRGHSSHHPRSPHSPSGITTGTPRFDLRCPLRHTIRPSTPLPLCD